MASALPYSGLVLCAVTCASAGEVSNMKASTNFRISYAPPEAPKPSE